MHTKGPMKYFTIFDKKTGAYNPQIFAATSIPEAVRSIIMATEDGKGSLSKFPSDYVLYLVGDFDPQSGLVTPPTQTGPMLIQEIAQIMSEHHLSSKAVKP